MASASVALLTALLGAGATSACSKAAPTLDDKPASLECVIPTSESEAARPVKSLPVEPHVAWTHPLLNAPLEQPLAASATRVAASVASTLLVLDAQGGALGEVRGSEGRRLSPPAFDREDNVYVADELALRSFDARLQERWTRPLHAAKSAAEFLPPWTPRLTSDGAALQLGLDGTLCRFDAARGDGDDCTPIPAGLSAQALGPAVPGGRYVSVTDTSSLARYSVLLRASGDTRARTVATSDGRRWVITHASPALGLVGVHVGDRGARSEVTVFDACGSPRWKVPGDHVRPAGVAFGAELVVIDAFTSDTADSHYRLRRFSAKGALLATSAELHPAHVIGLGSDDTLYLLSCLPKGESRAELVALGSDLAARWSLPADSSDCAPGAVLAPNGTVYLTRRARLGGAHELVAIRTSSPGSAATIFAATPGDVQL